MSEGTPMTGDQMLEVRKTALDYAVQHGGPAVAVPQVLHNAGCFLAFLLTGQPVENIGESISGGAIDAASAPKAPPATAPKPVTKPRTAAATTAAATPAPKPAEVAAASAAKAANAKSAQEVPAPVTLIEAGAELKKLVLDTTRGGRPAAEALLAKYGVTTMSQIPQPKLAQFVADLKAAGTAGETDPPSDGADLLS